MIINVLTEDHSPNGFAFNYLLKKNQRIFRDMGYILKFILDDPYDKHLPECDMLWINSKIFRKRWVNQKQIETVYERFDFYKSKIDNVFYFDTKDSSGSLNRNILSMVDRYYKSFLLKDKKQYMENLYGGRIYTDYYHRHFKITDDENIPEQLQKIEKSEDLAKIRLSWCPMEFMQKLKYRANPFLKRFFHPQKKRNIPISCRIGIGYKRNTLRFHREQIRNSLQKMNVPVERLRFVKYLNELRNAKIGISPFGAGEFAFRDYEIFLNGCVLVKPDMSHMETWPDFYLPDKTYIPFKWDFTDLKEQVEFLLDNPSECVRIAEEGQTIFRRYFEEDSGNNSFIEKIKDIVNEA